MTAPPGPEQPAGPPQRPHDVETAFWLWVAALPLMIVGYLVSSLAAPERNSSIFVATLSVLFVVTLAAVAATFIVLMRHGYRWARVALTGGGVASIVNVAFTLFRMDLPPVPALTYAVCVIVGSVLIAGGIYLVNRKDSHAFFVR